MYYNNIRIYFLALIILWPTPGYTMPPSTSDADSSEQIDSLHFIASEISKLHLSESCSDVILLVNGEPLPAHRTILALSSEYFRNLFYGDDGETYKLDVTYKSKVVIPEVPVKLFKILLEYMYTAQIQSCALKGPENLEFLMMLEVFDIPNLKSSDDAFKKELSDEINHINFFIRDISSLLTSKSFSDAGLVVEGERLSVHRFLLAARIEYFRALFYGEGKDTYKLDVTINDVPLTAFNILLQYVYTGQIPSNIPEDRHIFDLLMITDYFGISNLKQKLHKYLQKYINLSNVCTFFTLARLYQYEELKIISHDFIENNVWDVLRSDNFLDLPTGDLLEILNRDTFYAEEIDIFRTVCRWINENKRQLDSHTELKVLSAVRYPLMSGEELSEARESKLVSSDIISAAIQYRHSLSPDKPQFRGVLKPNEYLPYEIFPANNNTDRGTNKIKLKKPSTINYIEITLCYEVGVAIDHSETYSYYIEVSNNGQDWTRVIDHSNYNCHSLQILWIHPQVVQYIQIVGTNLNSNSSFNVYDVQYNTKDMHNIEINNGLVVPKDKYNVTTSERNACIIEGQNSVHNKTLIDLLSIDDIFRRVLLYTYHRLGSGCIVLHLAQPYILSSMRLLLWGDDDQKYCYKIEASLDNRHWEIIVDKSMELSGSWQDLQFNSRPILYIRITGVFSTSGNDFRCVYLEAPAQVTPDNLLEDEETDIMMP